MTRRRARQAAAARSGRRGGSNGDLPEGGADDMGGSFYVSASGRVTGSNESQNSIFAKQLPHIREALGKRIVGNLYCTIRARV